MAAKPLMDAQALIDLFANASARQGEAVRKAVAAATLQALQARELTLKNIRGTLETVTRAASTGLAQNAMGTVDATAMLDRAVTGMDEALLRAVEANRTALSTLAAQGADLREKHLKKALADIEKMEDTLMSVVTKAATTAAQQVDNAAPAMPGLQGLSGLASAWGPVLEKMNAGGTLSGAGAAKAVEQLMAQMQGAVRTSRAASLQAVQALAESYAALASGVLIGMSEGLNQGQKKSGGTRKG
jgi:hypothetical protein